MKIEKSGLHVFRAQNQRDFNRLIAPVVTSMFQDENEGPIGYVQSATSEPDRSDWFSWSTVDEILVEGSGQCPPDDTRLSLAGLGDWERTVLTNLIWGNYSTLVLAGERGSGKTALMKEIRRVLKRPRPAGCSRCGRKECPNPTILDMDLNLGGEASSPQEVKDDFLESFYQTTSANLRPLLESYDTLEKLYSYLQRNVRQQYVSSYDPWVSRVGRRYDKWLAEGNKARCSDLLSFVASSSPSIRRRTENLMVLLRFVREEIYPDNACFVILLDNIDRVIPEAQHDLLQLILSLRKIARVRLLLPLRWTTFEQVRSQRAYSFGLLTHRGPGLGPIMRKRLAHYRENWQQHAEIQVLDPQTRSLLLSRLEAIQTLFEHPSYNEFASWLAGRSVRIGLRVARRLLLNATIPHDRRPTNLGDLTRSLFLGINREQRLEVHDDCVANLFANPLDEKFDLLNLRILQLIKAYRAAPRSRSVRNLTAILHASKLWSLEEIRAAYQYLADLDRPLIWIDGRSTFASHQEIRRLNRVVYLTKAGDNYIRFLARNSLYVQEALIAVRWNSDFTVDHFDYGTLEGRFSLLRKCLGVFRDTDVSQTVAFLAIERSSPYSFGLSWILFSNVIIGATAKTLLAISERRKGRGESYPEEELKSWLGFLNDSFTAESKCLDRNNEVLRKLARDYERFLGIDSVD